MTERPRVVYKASQLAAHAARMGKVISRDYAGRTLDVVIILENAFMFGADLVRHISCPTVCHFVRAEQRDIQLGGFDRREIFFSHEPDLKGRHVLVVDTVLQSGVTMDFLAKRLLETQPRSLRVAVMIDRPHDRHVDLQPAYFGLRAASKYLVGYGLPGRHGLYRNLPYVGTVGSSAARKPRGKRRAKRRS